MAAMFYKTVSFIRETVQLAGIAAPAFNWREVSLAGVNPAVFTMQPLTSVVDPGTLLTQTYGPQGWQIAGVVISPEGTTMSFALQRPKT